LQALLLLRVLKSCFTGTKVQILTQLKEQALLLRVLKPSSVRLCLSGALAFLALLVQENQYRFTSTRVQMLTRLKKQVVFEWGSGISSLYYSQCVKVCSKTTSKASSKASRKKNSSKASRKLAVKLVVKLVERC